MQTVTMSFSRVLWNKFLSAANCDACHDLITSPEMMQVGDWLVENTQGTDYGPDGVNRIQMPVQLASYLLGACALFAVNKYTAALAPWASIGYSLNQELYETIAKQTFLMLSEKDYSEKGFQYYGPKQSYSDN